MKTVTKACLVGTILVVGIGAQVPALKKGVSVDLPVASHAVETREADDQNALVVAIAANGRVYVGSEPREPVALSRLSEGTVYIKVDVRAPYQTVLAALDALHGKSVVLLSAPPETTSRRGYVPLYGTKLTVSQ